MTSLSPDRPLMISVPVSPYVELARWTLDRLGVQYVEERHAPVLNTLAARGHRGSIGWLGVGSRVSVDRPRILRAGPSESGRSALAKAPGGETPQDSVDPS